MIAATAIGETRLLQMAAVLTWTEWGWNVFYGGHQAEDRAAASAQMSISTVFPAGVA